MIRSGQLISPLASLLRPPCLVRLSGLLCKMWKYRCEWSQWPMACILQILRFYSVSVFALFIEIFCPRVAWLCKERGQFGEYRSPREEKRIKSPKRRRSLHTALSSPPLALQC